jgi:hypothetical protein
MKIGFDLDGTLDRPVIRDLALALMNTGWEVHVVTGVFPEALGWQDAAAKRKKLGRLNIPYTEFQNSEFQTTITGTVTLHILDAVPATYSRDYRLADLGLRKGALCEELGITLFLDDSSTYCEMIPKMSGATTVLHVQ